MTRLLNGTNRYGEFTAPLRDDEIPRYPPFQKGLPAVHSHRLLVTQRELIREIQVAADIEDDLWERLFVPMIERYAAFVHLLPASEAHHHRGAGGLFRHGLETALYALRLSRQYLFDTGLPPKQVKRRKPRWSATIFVAAMCHDLGKPITDVRVRNYAGTEEWPAWTTSLDEWLHDSRIDHYVLEWVPGRKGDHETITDPVVFWKVVAPEFVAWLADGGRDFMPRLQRALRTQGAESRVAVLVAAADRTSVEKDLQSSPVGSDISLGVPVERHIIEGMRHLLSTGAWKVNVPGARVWHLKSQAESGLYVVWNQDSVEQLRDYFTRYMLNGVPRSPEGIADALIERAFATENDHQDGTPARLWSIAPAILNDHTPPRNADRLAGLPLDGDRPAEPVIQACRLVTLRALRLASPAVLFDYNEPPPPLDGFVEAEIHAEAERRAWILVRGAPPELECDDAQSDSNTANDERDESPVDVDADHPPVEVPAAAPPIPSGESSVVTARPSVFSGVSEALAELLTRRPDDILWRLDSGRWMLGYPEPLERYVRPAEDVLEELKAKDLIEPHPKVRTRWVHDHEGSRGLLLSEAASKALDDVAQADAGVVAKGESEAAAARRASSLPRKNLATRRALSPAKRKAASSDTTDRAPDASQPSLAGLDTTTSDQDLAKRTVHALYSQLVEQGIEGRSEPPKKRPKGAKTTDQWTAFSFEDVQSACNRRSLLDAQGRAVTFGRLESISRHADGLLLLQYFPRGVFFNTTRISLRPVSGDSGG